jgi:hypothetical protein
VAALLALLALFVVALAVGLTTHPTDRVESPAHSRMRLVEDVFPPRHLTAADIRRGGPTCLEGDSLVIGPGGGCTFIVPKGVHVVDFRRVPGSPAMTVTLDRTGDFTQDIDTGQPGPDPDDPLGLRLATVHNGVTVTLSGCLGPSRCRLDLATP